MNLCAKSQAMLARRHRADSRITCFKLLVACGVVWLRCSVVCGLGRTADTNVMCIIVQFPTEHVLLVEMQAPVAEVMLGARKIRDDENDMGGEDEWEEEELSEEVDENLPYKI